MAVVSNLYPMIRIAKMSLAPLATAVLVGKTVAAVADIIQKEVELSYLKGIRDALHDSSDDTRITDRFASIAGTSNMHLYKISEGLYQGSSIKLLELLAAQGLHISIDKGWVAVDYEVEA